VAPRLDAALTELGTLLGPRLSRNATVLEHHSHDESHHLPHAPDAVAFAESTEEVAAIVRTCHRHGVPVVPWGVGTSLEGNATPLHGGVSLDLSHMDRVLRVGTEDLDCTVQPGIRRSVLNAALASHGLFFPVDPGADATLGGMASTGASGTTTVKYGAMRDLVLGLTVVTPTGEVITTARRARKTSAGYDLTHLFVGAEGTLGVITELHLRVFGIPEVIAAATIGFPSVRAAVDGVIETIQLALGVARIELVDADAVVAVNAHSGVDLPVAHLLLLEFHGSAAAVAHDVAAVREVLERHGGTDYRETTDAGERARLWRARHEASTACRAMRPGAGRYATDVCVPISRLADCIDATRADLADSGIYGPILGHVGDGNFHVLIAVDPHDPDEVRRVDEFHSRLVRRALAMEGTCTGEHGIGVGKMPYLVEELGAGAVGVMSAIKAALDPAGIMNPGKVVPTRVG
jgi:D-lactate dehydrogenase (cytochrome)